jgi:hypothetical protein
MFFVPVFKHHGIRYRVESTSVQRSVAHCARGTRWRPSVERTVTGGPPHTPARYTKVDASLEGDEDFTILVPVYGNRKYFEERSQLERWKDHVVVILEVTAPTCGPSRSR